MHSEEFKKITEICQEYYLSTNDNVVGVGYGYKTINGQLSEDQSIVFTVKNKIPASELSKDELIPKNISIGGLDLKTDVIQGEYKMLASMYDPYTKQTFSPTNRNKIRPLKGGISVTNYTALADYVGTLGLIAVDNDTNSLVGVSNAHVLIDDASLCSYRYPTVPYTNVKSHNVVQPNELNNSSGSNSIGIVKRYLPYDMINNNYADVALCTISESDISYSTSFLQEGLNYLQPLPFATTTEINNLLNTSPFLFSSGRTTGAKGEGTKKLRFSQYTAMTSMVVNMQNNDYLIDFADSIEFVARDGSNFNSPIVNFPIDSGDSGSVLIAEINGVRKIIGLVFAGLFNNGVCVSGLANRIDNVASLINISAWNGSANYSFSDNASIEEHFEDGFDSREYLIIDGKKFWQVGLVDGN